MGSIAVTIVLITLVTITVYTLAALSFLQIERETRRTVPIAVISSVPPQTPSERTFE